MMSTLALCTVYKNGAPSVPLPLPVELRVGSVIELMMQAAIVQVKDLDVSAAINGQFVSLAFTKRVPVKSSDP